jgi:hypothetical protein
MFPEIERELSGEKERIRGKRRRNRIKIWGNNFRCILPKKINRRDSGTFNSAPLADRARIMFDTGQIHRISLEKKG